MPTKHKWKFKSHFRREAYRWKGTAPASKRMRIAMAGGKLEEFREQLGRKILEKSCKANLREVVVRKLGQDG